MRRRVAVLMGGRSSEHEVSLASAEAVIAALDPDRDEVIPVLIAPDSALQKVANLAVPCGSQRAFP